MKRRKSGRAACLIKANKLRINLREIRIIILQTRDRGFKSSPAQAILCRCP